eukprot:4851695-Pleurochrysis_carterae.AAC.5
MVIGASLAATAPAAEASFAGKGCVGASGAHYARRGTTAAPSYALKYRYPGYLLKCNGMSQQVCHVTEHCMASDKWRARQM